MSTAIFWFRQDLRLSDNPALLAACQCYDQVLPIYIDDQHLLPSQLGKASQAWLHHSLSQLQQSLQRHGSDLFFFKGDASSTLQQLTQQLNIDAVFWNRCYESQAITRDTQLKAALHAQGIYAHSDNALLFNEPWQILKKDQTPYRVFTPYWKQVRQQGLLKPPSPAPQTIPSLPALSSHSFGTLDTLKLLQHPNWPSKVMSHWQVGEAAAQQSLTTFIEQAGVFHYAAKRDFPSQPATSKLSPHLHFGEISPRQILWQCLSDKPLDEIDKGTDTFIKEVIWREFAYYILFHFPETQQQAMYPQFHQFPWRDDLEEPLTCWQQGKTGFPIVDAGMRELWETGWMHNRVRMIVASFLSKNLLINWQQGERWFRDTLVDADFASNTLGWQWASGCGADAAPYFRIFNPVRQSETFDPDGDYLRRWLPELASLDNKHIHQPWNMPASQRASLDYPQPIVDLSASRQRALDAYATIKKQAN